MIAVTVEIKQRGKTVKKQDVVIQSTSTLTPQSARFALQLAFGSQNHSGSIWVWDKHANVGYRLYSKSARKVTK